MENNALKVIYEPGVAKEAEKIFEIYPGIKAKIEFLFKWRFTKKPSLVLINNRKKFLKLADHPITVAFANPEANLIVVDYSTVATKPFSLETTLTHEFCHLLLHSRLPKIPRWFDEGLCQWASGGLDEIRYNQKQSALNQASITGHFIPFENLKEGFPTSKSARILAYEQSKNFVDYLSRRFGLDRLRKVLDEMKNGADFNTASSKIYRVSAERLENDWRESIRRNWTWLTYLSNHIYIFLFVAGAVITIAGFLKFLRKKRNYKDDFWDKDENDWIA